MTATDKPEEEFAYSLNQEDYSYAYGDREQALFEATQAVNDDTGDNDRCLHTPGDIVTVYTGRCVKHPSSRYISGVADTILDHAREAAYDDTGEHSENWLDSVTSEQEADLDAALCAAFDAWCEKHKHNPTFYSLADVQKHEVVAQGTEDEAISLGAAEGGDRRVAKIAALVRERDLLLIERDLTPEEVAQLAEAQAFLALPENDGPGTAAVRRLLEEEKRDGSCLACGAAPGVPCTHERT